MTLPGNMAPSKPARNRLWGNGLYVVATVIYLATLAATFFTLDQSYYTTRKIDVVGPQVVASMDADSYTALERAASNYLTRAASEDLELRARTRDELLQSMQQFLDSVPFIVGVTFGDAEGQVEERVQDLTRVSKQHDFSNSLLTRSFMRSVRRAFVDRGTQRQWILRIDYTTPKDSPAVEALTDHYRMVMIVAFLILTLIYYLLLVSIFAPLRRVTLYMRSRDDPGSSIIPHPKTMLEKTYNDLARDATLTRLSKDLRDTISRKGLSYAEPVLEEVPELFERFIGLKTCQVYTFSHHQSGWRLERSFKRPAPWLDEPRFVTQLLEMLASNDPAEKPEQWTARHVAQGDFFCDTLNQTSEYLWLLVIHCGKLRVQKGQWWLDFYGRAAQELRYAIGSIEDQRRLILQEKSKANISLSRNLGHDLTNIIATSKLELMTVRTFLSLSPSEIASSPVKEAIFKESLQALLNNTRFLQEIVNIYRSFSFLEKPKFEEVNLSELVADVVALYKLSLSRTFSLQTELAGDIPSIRVEPRLLRLALFNILNNACDAIKQSTSPEHAEGGITVITRYVPEKHRVEIAVEDTGPGIRDSNGQLMNQDSLADIFRLGFSTKANQEGEGLGLNWVQTIVREFHSGEVIAMNRPGGGAVFSIRLPLNTSGTEQPKKNTNNIPAEV